MVQTGRVHWAPTLALIWLVLASGAKFADSKKKKRRTKRTTNLNGAHEMPHIFSDLPTFEKLKQQGSLVDQNGDESDGSNFLTPQDVEIVTKAMAQVPPPLSAKDLGMQGCEIPRVTRRIAFDDFMDEYGERAAILSATARVGTLPFELTPRIVAANLPRGMLNPCLCRPQHGSNFHDRAKEIGQVKAVDEKRYCLWQLPLFFEMVLSNTTGASMLRSDPYSDARLEEDVIVSNSHLAKTLPFQCRVGSGDTPHNQKLIDAVVHNLGRERPATSPAELESGEPPWWGSNLVRAAGKPRGFSANFHSATLWLSTAGSRTPLHMDAQPQFLVQLQGNKHVTIFPQLGSNGGTNLKTFAHGRGGMLNLTAAAAELLRNGHALETELGTAAQRCLLRPGEVLWMPPEVHHDVYALESSVSLNMRFNELETASKRGKRKKGEL